MYVILITLIFIMVGSVIFTIFSERKPLLPPIDPRYKKAELSDLERIDDLLQHMTLEEKIGQMALVEKNSVEDLADIRRYGIGGVLSGAGAKPENNTAEGWREMVGMFDRISRTSRLGIPVLYGVDANHGHGNVPGATIFPHFIGLGAAGDTALTEAVASATREALLATGVTWSYSPTLDLPEDIRWGRVYESFGSDPVRVGQLGAAYLSGLQGADSPEKIAILATPKHYVGGGSMLWNSSSNEDYRIDQGMTEPEETKLREVYLPPFEAALRAGALSVMVGLNSWGDTKLSASPYLITDVLKGELEFPGFVVSDWYGVYEIPGGEYRAAVTAINAGVDMVMLPFDYRTFIRNVSQAVRRGEISESRIDDAVRRILRAKFALGLFERNFEENNAHQFDSEVHRTLARDAVAKSAVLLKNDGVLPVRQNISRIRVAGSAADNVGKQMGAWTVEWQGIDGNWLPGGTSILAGIREGATDDMVVEFSEDGSFLEDSPRADLGIAVVGESPYAEGWGDSTEPRVSPADLALIERLKNQSERVLVVLVTGRPLIITEEIGNWDGLVVVWLPGSEGGGVADVLFGKKPFTGMLPIAWPRNIAQLPIDHEGVTADGTNPLFLRGFGLR